MSNGKAMIIHLIGGFIKKTLYKMSQYFPKPYQNFGGDINVKVDLSNYATRTDLKKATENLALKSNLANLKTKVDKTDVDKFKTVPADLSKLSNVADNDVVKKTKYDKLDAKVNNIGTSGFVLKTKYDTDNPDLEIKLLILVGLLDKTDFNRVKYLVLAVYLLMMH